jgi:hypothetical protein
MPPSHVRDQLGRDSESVPVRRIAAKERITVHDLDAGPLVVSTLAEAAMRCANGALQMLFFVPFDLAGIEVENAGNDANFFG